MEIPSNINGRETRVLCLLSQWISWERIFVILERPIKHGIGFMAKAKENINLKDLFLSILDEIKLLQLLNWILTKIGYKKSYFNSNKTRISFDSELFEIKYVASFWHKTLTTILQFWYYLTFVDVIWRY